jgi:peptide/nickel transport system substrate-binding protein
MGLGLGLSVPGTAQTPVTLVIAQGVDIYSGDPQKSPQLHTYNVISNIYETLIDRDASLRLRPGLATSWTPINPTTWEFRLRKGVTFHNGEPFNAEAVKFSFDRGLDPATKWPRRGFIRLIKSVAVVDDYTVRMTAETPWRGFLQAVGTVGWIIPPQYTKTNGDQGLALHPVGTGPYKFVRWVKDDRVELEGNPNYWRGVPKIQRLVFRSIPSEASRLAELLSGSVQLINLIPPEEFDPVRNSPQTKLISAPAAAMYYIQLNLVNLPTGRPLADKRVRQALNYAVDRKALIGNIMHNVGTPVASICTPIMFGCDMSIQPYPFDPAKAKALLAQAGYANGFDMTIATSNGGYPADRDLTEAIASQLTQVGVRAKAVVVEYGLLLDQLATRKLPYDAAFARITSFTSQTSEMGRAFTTLGITATQEPDVPAFRKAIDSAEIATSENQAKEYLKQAQLVYIDEGMGISLFTSPNVYGVSRHLDFTPRADYLLPMYDASWK